MLTYDSPMQVEQPVPLEPDEQPVPLEPDEWLSQWLALARHPRTRFARRVFRALPHGPRCKHCSAPFHGPGRVLKYAGFGPSRKSPAICERCTTMAPVGGAVLEIGVLFADVRGFTTLSEQRTPKDVAAMANRFYRAATTALLLHDAMIDKFAGDSVLALFLPFWFEDQEEVAGAMLQAGLDLRRAIADAGLPGVEVGVGMDWGPAHVGNVGVDGVKDFTALGDVVNTASRLQGVAAGGEVVVSGRVWERLALDRRPPARVDLVDLRGKADREPVHVVGPA